MACSDIKVGPLEITIEDWDGAGNDLVIGPDDQDGPATVTITTQMFPKMTQKSVYPCGFSRQGQEIRVTLSLNTYGIEEFAFFTQNPVIVDGTTATKKKAEGKDLTGDIPSNYNIILKPVTDGGVPSTNANEWITLPAGTLIDQSLAMTFSKDSQVNIPVEIYGAPDANGVRYIRGDVTAVAA